MLTPRPNTPENGEADWSPAVLKGRIIPAAAEVKIELGGTAETCRCVGIAEDGFVIESERALPLQQVLRCTLRMPGAGEFDLFAFAVADQVEARQEIKPMGMSGEVAKRWGALLQKLDGGPRARGTGPTRPLPSGGYTSIPRSRGDWFWRMLGRLH